MPKGYWIVRVDITNQEQYKQYMAANAEPFKSGAQARGAQLLPHTAVTRVLINNGQVTGVDTDKGTIRTPIVVDAAGAWTRQVVNCM